MDKNLLNSYLINRRELVVGAGVAGLALSARSWDNVPGANARLRVAMIGGGGIANGQGMPQINQYGSCPFIVDVDPGMCKNAVTTFPGAKVMSDYRKLYDQHAKDFDAVVVSTPDHHHYPATILGMMAGKHVYTQKPLAHTVWEARQLLAARDRYKVATSMGNQMHANEGNRRLVEWVRSGLLGGVLKAHAWTNRSGPWWKQGMVRPEGELPVPTGLDWDCWLGPAPVRSYNAGLHPFLWRGVRDFGTGALGDMGCHTLDGTFWALGLNHFKSVELVDGVGLGKDANAWPKAKEDYAKPELPGGSTVRFVFGERQVDGKSMPELSLTWYEGGRKPARPEGLHADVQLQASGVLLECEKGWLVGLDDYCNNIVIVMKDADPAAKAAQEKGCKIYGNVTAPAKSLKRSEGHWEEWFAAAKGDKPFDYPAANFAYAAPFTETLLAATLVQVTGGKLEYDAAAMRFTNSELATSLLTKEYRKGWDFRMS